MESSEIYRSKQCTNTRLRGFRSDRARAAACAGQRPVFRAPCIRSGDRDRFVRLYAQDAVLLANGTPPLLGHAGAGHFFAVLMDKGIAEVRLSTIEIEVTGDTGWERGSSEAANCDEKIVGRENYIVIWKKTDEGWKLLRDIMNTGGQNNGIAARRRIPVGWAKAHNGGRTT